MCEIQNVKTIIFIDYDNISVKQLAEITKLNNNVSLRLYVNNHANDKLLNEKFQKLVQDSSCEIQEYVVEYGKNSTDFQIVSDITEELATNKALNDVYIVSKDGGFDTILESLAVKYPLIHIGTRKENMSECILEHRFFNAETVVELKSLMDDMYGMRVSDDVYKHLIEIIARWE